MAVTASPAAADEPGVNPMAEEELDVDEIQGNILAGFNKDHQTFLFLALDRTPGGLQRAREWLRAISKEVSSLAEVQAFNSMFRAMRLRLGRDPDGLIATWSNIAFSFEALRALTSEAEVSAFRDRAFTDGLATWSSELGDPDLPTKEGHPDNWLFGGTNNGVDIVLVIASDDCTKLAERVGTIKATLDAGSLRIVYEQQGETLPEPLRGHEHFGFKDGVSQPGVRGVVGRDKPEFLTPRLIDPVHTPQLDAYQPEYARPGQPLIWPGQFVFGYKRQRPLDPRQPDVPAAGVPEWARNGSFMVVRRLRQDVESFHAFMEREAARLAQAPGFSDVTAPLLAAKFVGRWPSGAPISRAPDGDVHELGDDEHAINYFLFQSDSDPPPPLRAELGYAGDRYTLAPADGSGTRCPRSAHIRKMNPRDATTEQGRSSDTLARLILRRGIPFGRPAPTPTPEGRGLLFVSYQTSIERQFVFLQKNWANHHDNPNSGGGHDPVIGQNLTALDRSRVVDLPSTEAADQNIRLDSEWVIPTGGGFFFSPAISVIAGMLTGGGAAAFRAPKAAPRVPKSVKTVKAVFPPRWINGSADCTANHDPAFQVHALDPDTYVLRQNKCDNFEAPFSYLLFGSRAALLFDSGSKPNAGRARQIRTVVEEILSARGVENVHLVVAHSHGHADHHAGDQGLAMRPNTHVVGSSLDEIIKMFAITRWPLSEGAIDLGHRRLVVLPTPGHEPRHIMLYDEATTNLFSGDMLYPGILVVNDWDAYRQSAARLAAFANQHRITYVLGAHIEMTRVAGKVYPYGTTFQPEEHVLQLTIEHLHELNDVCERLGNAPVRTPRNDFVIEPSP
jgi:Dyp-type peroxidase family